MTIARAGIAQYQQVGNEAVAYADPWQLIGMLFDGALDRLAQARHAMQVGQIAVKGERIGKAISILDGLRGSLNHELDPQFAGHLDALYEYMQRRLLEASLHNAEPALDEVVGLLREIKSGWDSIPPEARNADRLQAENRGTAG